MVGRQVIRTGRAFTLQELADFMDERWDRAQYCDFVIGRPTAASVEKYILLPATHRFMVIVFPRRAGGLFSRGDKVVLSVCDTPDGVKQDFARSIHSHNAFFGAWKINTTMSMEAERKGPAEEILQAYAAYLRRLLTEAGYAQ